MMPLIKTETAVHNTMPTPIGHTPEFFKAVLRWVIRVFSSLVDCRFIRAWELLSQAGSSSAHL
jgi:hypothetical protein